MEKKIEITIIDDQRLYREGLAALLKGHNIIVTEEAENGEQGLNLIKSTRNKIVLLDLEMPKLNGSQTLDIIKKQFPETRVIIISQYNEETLIEDLFTRGASAYVTKNCSVETMVEAIRAVKDNLIYKNNIPALLEAGKLEAKKQYYKLIFSRREREIIHLLCSGKSINKMSQILCVSEKTIGTHLTQIYKKTSVTSRAEFVTHAVKEGLEFLGIKTHHK